MDTQGARILRRAEVRRRTGLSDPTIWRKESAGEFPQKIRLGPKSVGWLESEIDDWIAGLADDRPKRPGEE